MNDSALLVLSGASVFAVIALIVRRFSFFGISTRFHRRLLFVDFVLLVMALEVFVDTLIDIQPKPPNGSLEFVAYIGRGAVVVAMFALLATFPGDQD